MLSERTKKIFLISGFVASVIGIGAALYFMFWKPLVEPTIIEEEAVGETGAGALPEAGLGQGAVTEPEVPGALPKASEVARGGLTKTTMLTNSAVAEVALSSDGQGMNYYDQNDGRFYAINQDGEVVRLSNKQFPDVENTAWNSDGDKAVIEFPDGSNIVYDFTNETQVTLPKHWDDFEFSPGRDQIIAKSLTDDPNSRMLLVSNADGSQAKAVQALGENADKVQVSPSPTNQIIAFSDTAGDQGDFGKKMILPIGQNQENFKGLTVDGLGFDSIWSPRGDSILYSVYSQSSDFKPLLWIVDGTINSLGDDRRALGLYTWVDKCVYAENDLIYCAVPQDLDPNAGLQRTLFEHEPDDLYKIDLATGRSSMIARPEESVAMEDLQTSSDGSLIYFTDAVTGRLGFIKLN
jgi:hypothetical protein